MDREQRLQQIAAQQLTAMSSSTQGVLSPGSISASSNGLNPLQMVHPTTPSSFPSPLMNLPNISGQNASFMQRILESLHNETQIMDQLNEVFEDIFNMISDIEEQTGMLYYGQLPPQAFAQVLRRLIDFKLLLKHSGFQSITDADVNQVVSQLEKMSLSPF